MTAEVQDATAQRVQAADPPLLSVRNLGKRFGPRAACRGVAFDLWPGEVLAIVGESGAGKTTVLNCLSGQVEPDAGEAFYLARDGRTRDVFQLADVERRRLMRTEWGVIHQNPRDGLRFGVSAGANAGERLMAGGLRHYGAIRRAAEDWLGRLEIEAERIDELPAAFSGGMQQRLQIARNLISSPRLVLMDEPTGGLDVSVQARLLDLLSQLVRDLKLSAVLVTHDLAVSRLLADRMAVMRAGEIVELGLTDRLLDDPHHPYTQLLVSCMVQI